MKAVKNYYNLLGIPSSATELEIREAFRSKIVQFHHDKTPGDPSDLCYDLIEAYRVLSNRNTRKKYDIDWDKLNRQLTDAELVEKYKRQFARDEFDQVVVTPELLAELRQAHNAERAELLRDRLRPIKAICYNTENLLSTTFRNDIQNWQNSCRAIKLHDNFFATYCDVMEEIEQSGNLQSARVDPYWCDLCRMNYLSEEHHSERVIKPYFIYLGVNNESRKTNRDNCSALYHFYSDAIGPWFDFDPILLQSKASIWSYEVWSNFQKVCENVREFIEELPDPEHFRDTEEHVTYINKCTWADPSTVYFTCWVLIYNDLESLKSKAKDQLHESILDEDVTELLIFLAVLKEFLGFEQYDWNKLKNSALDVDDFEMTFVYTHVLTQLGSATHNEWLLPFQTVTFLQNNSELLQFWFRFAIETGNIDVDTVCDYYIDHGDTSAAISFYLEGYPLSKLLTKYTEILESEPIAAEAFRTVYFAQKIKSVLHRMNEESSNLAEMLEDLIELTPLAVKNPTEGYRFLMESFPGRICNPEFYSVHFWTIERLTQHVTSETFQVILAGWHFLEAENEVDEDFLEFHSKRLLTTELRKALDTYDFEILTQALKSLNLRNISAAQEILDELTQQNDLSNYVEAMKRIISGTIQTVRKNWIAAISNYQDALLNAPEINYRLTPCISQLTQDFELHQGILNKVQEKVEELRTNFALGNYVTFPNQDEISNSLVFSHPNPQHDFKYCDYVGKIQTQEPKLPGIEHPPENLAQIPEPINTPNVTLEKCERAIETGEEGKPLGPADAAFAYLDLLESLPLEMRHGPIVMAASHFLRATELAEDFNSAFAYNRAIVSLANRLIQLDSTNQARVQSCLTHKHMFSILMLANQCLSKWKEAEGDHNNESSETLAPTQVEKDDDPEDGQINEESAEKLISCSDKIVISKLLQSVVGFSKVEPLLNIPCLTSSDLSYVEKVKTQFLHRFCLDKVKDRRTSLQKYSSIDHAYTLFLEILHGRTESIPFETAKQTLIDAILEEHQISMTQLTKFISWPFLPGFSRSDGWVGRSSSGGLHFHPQFKAFESIEGFKLNRTSGEISFLLKSGRAHFTEQDIFEIFQNSLTTSNLTILEDSSCLVPNPFQNVTFDPPQLAGTDYLKTLLRISQLLTTFTSGMEVNSNPPFLTREVEVEFLDRLPTHLQYFLRPLRERVVTSPKKSDSDLSRYSFTLNLTHAYFEEEEDEDALFFKIGDLDLELTCAETPKGFVLDSNHNEQLSPAASFVQNFNNNYRSIGEYFPEFERLRELAKISLINFKLLEILNSSSYPIGVLSGIRSLGICPVSEIDFEATFEQECNFIPSSSCHTSPNAIHTSTSVVVNPQLIYGPVSTSSMGRFITTEELLMPKEEEDVVIYQEPTNSEIMFEVSATVTVYLRKEFLHMGEEIAQVTKPVILQHLHSCPEETDDNVDAEEYQTGPLFPFTLVVESATEDSSNSNSSVEFVSVSSHSEDDVESISGSEVTDSVYSLNALEEVLSSSDLSSSDHDADADVELKIESYSSTNDDDFDLRSFFDEVLTDEDKMESDDASESIDVKIKSAESDSSEISEILSEILAGVKQCVEFQNTGSVTVMDESDISEEESDRLLLSSEIIENTEKNAYDGKYKRVSLSSSEDSSQ